MWVGSTLCFDFRIQNGTVFFGRLFSGVSLASVVCVYFFFFFKGEKGFVQWPRCVLPELQLSVFKYAMWSEQGLKRPCWIPWGYFLHSVLAGCSSSWIRFMAKTLNLHYTWQPYSPDVFVPYHPQSYFFLLLQHLVSSLSLAPRSPNIPHSNLSKSWNCIKFVSVSFLHVRK